MPARIKIIKGKQAGAVFDLSEEIYLGRDDDNHIQILDETCSRHHARIRACESRHAVTDLGSNNGTFVNNERVEETVLKDGDRVLVGNTLFVYEEEKGTGFVEKGTVHVRGDDSGDIEVASSVSVQDLQVYPQGADAAKVADRLQRLYCVSQAIASTLDLGELLTLVLDQVFEGVKPDRGYLFLADERTGELSVSVARQPGEVREAHASDTILRRALDEGRSLLVADARAEAWLGGQESVLRYKVGSAMCAPLLARGVRLGAIYVHATGGGRAFSEEDLAFLTGIAQQAGLAIANARRFEACKEEIAELRRGAAPRPAMIGRSRGFSAVLSLVEKVAPTNATCLLTGETGTGKEVLARAIHDASPRRGKPMVAINCAALVETLLESELFGHERGAFTGANERRKGKFELAHTGTLFLDEISETSPAMQAKLLRVLQERQFYSIGGSRPVQVDVRIVAATNRKILQLVREGKFREDLYYRLSVVVIPIPPLRERPDDIPMLIYHFLERAAREIKKPVKGVSNEAMDLLQRYPWPGNIRELQNVIERCVVLADGPQIECDLIAPDIRAEAALAATGAARSEPAGGPLSLREAERQCIIRALAETGGKKGETTRLLGISWPTLNRKIEEYGIGAEGKSTP